MERNPRSNPRKYKVKWASVQSNGEERDLIVYTLASSIKIRWNEEAEARHQIPEEIDTNLQCYSRRPAEKKNIAF